jgi:glycosyltransferase involved in cell wall biosynthesis
MDFDPWVGPKQALEETWRWPLKKVTISNWLYQKVANSAASSGDTVNIAIGVDHRRYRITQDVAARPRRIAMLYGLASYKAPEDGLRALEIAKTRYPDLDAILFGPVARRPRGLASWMRYRGYCSDEEIVQIYNSSRIYVCCSLAEGFALPPAEAMACGCAIASTDCGGIREYAEDGVNCLLSAPGDSEALAGNIIRLLEDDSLRQSLALAGHGRIQDFTWDRSADLLEDFIKKRLAAN